MPDSNFLDEVEAEVFVGREPSWIVRSGIVLIASTLFLILAFSALIRYPDTLEARITLTTAEPPSELVARVNGRIERLLVSDAEEVLAGQPLMLLESSVDFGQLRRLEAQVSALQAALQSEAPLGFDGTTFELGGLGELQLASNQLARALAEYASFRDSPDDEVEAKHTESMRRRYLELRRQLDRKRVSYERKLALGRELLAGHLELAEHGLLAGSQVVALESQLLDQEVSLDDIDMQVEAYSLQVQELEHQLETFRIDRSETEQRLSREVRTRLRELNSAIQDWRRQFLLTAPVDGKVSLTRFWSAHQDVQRGDVVMVIVRDGSRKVGKLTVGQSGAGKIEPGQRVDIALDSYPSVEYGTLGATVAAVALVPDESGFRVDVEIPDALVSSHGHALSFTPNMVGTALIVTRDRRLLERLFDKVVYLLDADRI